MSKLLGHHFLIVFFFCEVGRFCVKLSVRITICHNVKAQHYPGSKASPSVECCKCNLRQ